MTHCQKNASLVGMCDIYLQLANPLFVKDGRSTKNRFMSCHESCKWYRLTYFTIT